MNTYVIVAHLALHHVSIATVVADLPVQAHPLVGPEPSVAQLAARRPRHPGAEVGARLRVAELLFR